MKKWSRNTKWRQGSMIFPSNCNLFSNNASDIIALAISHDCDIANDNLEQEPFVEFVLGKIIDTSNGNYEFAKNPRILHIEIKLAGNPVKMELISHKKEFVLKEILADFEPSDNPILGNINTLQGWLAARYRRQTLPDNLVNRLEPIFAFLEKKGKKYASGILGFYFDYDPKTTELGLEDPYEVWVYVVYPIDNLEAARDAMLIAQSLTEEFDILVDKTKQSGLVYLNECKSYSETEFTLHDYRRHIEYKLEHISYRMMPQGPIVD